jgi:uroporphyrinogen-III synthase
MKQSPLAGRRILVTRPKGQAENLSALIRDAGGEPLALPAIEIRELEDPASFFTVADRLESFDCAIFVSRNAVRKALQLLRARRGGKPWPAHLRLATVGGGSREELEVHGFSGVITPSAQSDSEGLLALRDFADVAGKRIVIFRGDGGRKLLGDTLAARGALVEHAPCYRRTLPEGGGAPFAAAWAGGTMDAVTVSSAEGLANLLEMLGGEAKPRLAQVALFVPHARVAEEAATRGLGRAIVGGPRDADMLAALVAYFGRAG